MGLKNQNRSVLVRLWLYGLAALCIGTAAPEAGATASPAEQQLIEALIAQVASMKDIVFIRNGSEHNSEDAAKHLRDKYNYFRNDIQTADDFIRLCATRSELSGLPYKVRDGNGKVSEAGPFLTAHLAELRVKMATPAPSGTVPASH